MASVQMMDKKAGWTTEKVLKHWSKKWGVDMEDLMKDKVTTAAAEALSNTILEPKKKSVSKKKSKKEPVKRAPVKKKSGASPLEFLKNNPEAVIKFSGSKAGKNADRFEKYKKSTTFQEFLDLGGENGDITYDYKRGLLNIPEYSSTEYTPIIKKEKSEKKNTKKVVPKKKKEEKKISVKKDNSEELDEDVSEIPHEPESQENSVEEPESQENSVEEPEALENSVEEPEPQDTPVVDDEETESDNEDSDDEDDGKLFNVHSDSDGESDDDN